MGYYSRQPARLLGNAASNGVTPSGSVAVLIHHIMSLSKPSGKRKVDDVHRQFHERWELEYFFVEHRGTPTCLVCAEKVAVVKEYNIRRHYSTRHAEEYRRFRTGSTFCSS